MVNTELATHLWDELMLSTETFMVDMYTTPFTSGRAVFYAIGLYLFTICSIRQVMRFFAPLRLKYLTAVHNLFLCLISLVMAAGCLYEYLTIDRSFYETACGPLGTSYRGRLFFWYYVFYLSKFYELLDTVILVLRKKPLTFLHVFHHIMTLTQFWVNTTWHIPPFLLIGPVFINTSVHVIMYFYYFLCALERYPHEKWKKRLTQMQLTQFIVDACFPLAWPIYEFWLAPRTCYGREIFPPLLAFNEFILVSFFILFSNFYYQQYHRRKSPPRQTSQSQQTSSVKPSGTTPSKGGKQKTK